MEVIGERRSARERIGPTNPGATVVIPGALWAMNRAVRSALIIGIADVLHDVRLATRGPANGGNVRAQHPERGPDPLSARKLDAGLHAPVSPRPFAFGQHPR